MLSPEEHPFSTLFEPMTQNHETSETSETSMFSVFKTFCTESKKQLLYAEVWEMTNEKNSFMTHMIKKAYSS